MFRKMSVGGKEVVLGVWDTAGSERYESMARLYYRSVRSNYLIAPYCVRSDWQSDRRANLMITTTFNRNQYAGEPRQP